MFISYLKKLLVVYSLWSVIYFALTILSNIRNQDFSLIGILKQIIINYFIYGSYYHLWFFPALIFAVIITTIFYKLNCMRILAYTSIILYFLGCMGCAYKNIAVNIPLISSLICSPYFIIIRRVVLMGLPFFLMGFFINIFTQKHPNIKTSQALIFVFFCILMFFAEISIVIFLNLQENIIITFALYPLLFGVIILLLNNPLENFQNIAILCRTSANFMYYSHPIFLTVFSGVSDILNIKIPSYIIFLLTVILTYCCGLIINKIDNKFINKFIY